MALSPVVQSFAVNAAEYLAGIDEMMAATERFAASIDSTVAASERLGVRTGTGAGAAAASGGTAAASTAAADESAAAADKNAASQERMAGAEKGAGEAATSEAGALGVLIARMDEVKAASTEVIAASDAETAAYYKTEAAAARTGETQQAAAAKGAESGKLLSGAFLGFTAAAAYGVVKAVSFQTEVTRLYTAAGLTGNNIGYVGQQILKVGTQTGYTGQQIAEAMYHPISAGLDLKTALAAVAQGANLANIHGASLDDTMYALSSVMKAFNYSAGDAGKTAALLNAIVGQGDMRFQDFNQSVKNWAPTAASMGISVQSMGAGIAYLTDRGNSAEVASTRLTMGLSMVTAGSKQANTFLKDLGLTTGSVALKNQTLAKTMNAAGLTTNKIASDLKKPDGLYVALSDIQGAFKKSGLSAAQADQVMAKIFGGGRSDKAILSLMQNLDGVKQKYNSIGQAVGGYGKSVKKEQETTGQKWKDDRAALTNLATTFGTMLLPAVNKTLGYLKDFANLLQRNHGAAQALAGLIGGVLAVAFERKLASGIHSVGKAFGDLGKAGKWLTGWGKDGPGAIGKVASSVGKLSSMTFSGLKSAGGWLADIGVKGGRAAISVGSLALSYAKAGASAALAAIKTAAYAVWQGVVSVATKVWAAAQWLLDAAMSANPITLIVIAVVALIGIFALLWVKCAAFRDFWKTVWKDIKKAFDDVWGFIKKNWMLIGGILLGPIALAVALIIKYWKQISDGFKKAWDLIKGWAADAWHFLDRIWSDIVGGVVHLWQMVVKYFLEIKNGAMNHLIELGNYISSLPGKILNWLGNLGSLLWNAGVNLVQGLINGVTSMFGAVASTAGNLVASLGHSVLHLLGIGSPSRVAHWWGQMVAEGLAGGITSGKSRVTGAAGQLAAGVASGLGSPYGGLAAGAGAGGGATITNHITVQGYIGNEQQLAQQLYLLIQRATLQSNHRNPTNGLNLLVR